MVETLLYQANARSADLLWDPVDTARRVLAVVDEVRPDHVIVDHLAFSARLALLAGGVPHADVVLGHPAPCRSATRSTAIRRPGRRRSTRIRTRWPPCCSGAGRSGTASPPSGTPRWKPLRRRPIRRPTRSPSTRTWCC